MDILISSKCSKYSKCLCPPPSLSRSRARALSLCFSLPELGTLSLSLSPMLTFTLPLSLSTSLSLARALSMSLFPAPTFSVSLWVYTSLGEAGHTIPLSLPLSPRRLRHSIRATACENPIHTEYTLAPPAAPLPTTPFVPSAASPTPLSAFSSRGTGLLVRSPCPSSPHLQYTTREVREAHRRAGRCRSCGPALHSPPRRVPWLYRRECVALFY